MSPPPAITKPLPSVDQDDWFRQEVRSHDASLKGYLRRAFPSVRDVDDMVQESYLRVWRARMAQPIQSAKAFLFQVARRLAIDAVRHARATRTESHADLSGLSVLDHGPDAAEALNYNEKVALLADALAALPARCREIVILRRLRGRPQKEVAAQLGISERTVESQLARGMTLCEKFLRKRGIRGFRRDE